MVHFHAKGLLILAEVTDALNQSVEGGKDPEHAEQPNPQVEALQLDCPTCVVHNFAQAH